jgi:hypothetical protein
MLMFQSGQGGKCRLCSHWGDENHARRQRGSAQALGTRLAPSRPLLTTMCSARQARLGLKAGVSARLLGSQGLAFLRTGPQDVESRE